MIYVFMQETFPRTNLQSEMRKVTYNFFLYQAICQNKKFELLLTTIQIGHASCVFKIFFKETKEVLNCS